MAEPPPAPGPGHSIAVLKAWPTSSDNLSMARLPGRRHGRSGHATSPVKRFAVFSVLPVIALGLLLSSTVRQLIQDRYLSTYAQSADVSVNSAASLVLTDPTLQAQVTTSGTGVLSSMIAAGGNTASLTALTAFGSNGTVEFSPIAGQVGQKEPISSLVRAAFSTRQSQARFVSAVPKSVHLSGPAVELAIPVRQNHTVLVVVRAYSSASRLDQGIAAGVRRMNLVLAAGLGLLWLFLFPVVLSASRRLRRQAAENAHMALHDSLTGLANRDLFANRLTQAIAAAERRNEKVGLVLLDLDRFKEVNDCLGHQHGDELLRHVSSVLSAQVRGSDTIARLGGDEFGVVLTGIETSEQALSAALRMASVLEVPVDIDGVAVTPLASMGMSLFPDHGSDADTLLGKADIAMYVAKADHQTLALYSPDRDFSVPARLGLVTELRRALRNDEIVCHYQPLAQMVDKDIWGVEALARWQHPVRGLLSPAEFLPVVEQAGLTEPLTRRVLHVALSQCRQWREEGLDLVVAVNLSARSLRDPGLPDLVFAALDEAGVPPENLELEITEDALLEDPAQAKLLLETLAARRVGISLDDFGTGYSSLAYLSHLPVTKVKIDRAFLADMSADDMNQRIVETVIDLGRRLEMQVLAEGVETAEVWQRLLDLGCPQAQGFYLAKPMPAEEFVAWRGLVATEPAAFAAPV